MPGEWILLMGVQGEARETVERAIRGRGHRLVAVESLSEGMAALQAEDWALVFLSLELPGSGLELAERIAGEVGAGGLVLVTREATGVLMMEALRRGVRDVLGTPASPETVEGVLDSLEREGGRIPLRRGGGDRVDLVGRSEELLAVFRTVGRVAASPASVLIEGESGTGKELVAREVHRLSGRAGAAFVAVNCAAIPEDLLESELFGHERGAFTGAVTRKIGRFERASGGTLFLDEIGDMSLVLQAKILRALQEREIERLGGEERVRVNVRVLAATHRDLGEMIQRSDFREDLYYRLAVVRIRLPALRERGGDVRELVLHYAAHFAEEYRSSLRYMSDGALQRLEGHDWPGNVRELRNVLERAVLMATGDTLRAGDIQLERRRPERVRGEVLPGYHPQLSMAEVERLHLAQVLSDVGGHLGRAAEILGVHRNTVSRKLQEYGLEGGR